MQDAIGAPVVDDLEQNLAKEEEEEENKEEDEDQAKENEVSFSLEHCLHL